MKINKKELVNKNDFREHLIIHALTSTLKDEAFKQFIQDEWNSDDPDAEIKLTVNGTELDLNSVCEHWQGQIDRMIKEKAVELVRESYEEKLDDIRELLDRVSDKIRETFNLPSEEE